MSTMAGSAFAGHSNIFAATRSQWGRLFSQLAAKLRVFTAGVPADQEKLAVTELPAELKAPAEQAIQILNDARRREGSGFGAVFQPLLGPFESLCGQVVRAALQDGVPTAKYDRNYYFNPYLGRLDPVFHARFERHGRRLESCLSSRTESLSPGTLLFCLTYAASSLDAPHIWRDVQQVFAAPGYQALLPILRSMQQFRNDHVVHPRGILTDRAIAGSALRTWVHGLKQLYRITQHPFVPEQPPEEQRTACTMALAA